MGQNVKLSKNMQNKMCNFSSLNYKTNLTFKFTLIFLKHFIRSTYANTIKIPTVVVINRYI